MKRMTRLETTPTTRAAPRVGRTRLLACLLAAWMLAVPASSQAADIGPVLYDVLIVRPVAMGHTAVGLILFGPAALLSLPAGGVSDAWATFVYAPSIDAFERPLGEF